MKEGIPSVWVSKPQMDDSGVVGDAPVDDCREKASSKDLSHHDNDEVVCPRVKSTSFNTELVPTCAGNGQNN